MSVEVFNRTKYSDQVLQDIAEFAHKACGIKGDVAVVFRYHANSSGFLGLMTPMYPFFFEVAANLKKFNNKKYRITRKNQMGEDITFTSATRDGSFGYITVRLPRAKSYLNVRDAKYALNTLLHEMFHIKQYRDRIWALKDAGYSDWRKFIGYTNGRNYKRVNHQSRGIEQHVNKLLRELQSTLDTNNEYDNCVQTLTESFTDEKIIQKAKKQKQSVKYNRFGERMSDYRNVKMNRLRSGDEVVRCPHCGEKAVVIDNYDERTYTHIAAVSDELVRHGYSAADARYTQFGHMIYEDGSVAEIKWGHTDLGNSEDCFKEYSRKGYYYR